VRWYLRYRLSAANVRDLLAERNFDVSSRTVLNWVQKFGPLLAEEGRRRARPVTGRWWVDETYLRLGGRWGYLYRAVDGRGQVIDVLLREHRDLDSARAFFTQAMARREVQPRTVVTDKHAGYPKAVAEDAGAHHVRTGLHRSRGETTQPIERSHALVKDRVRPMRGLQSVATGQRVLEGIELARAVRRGDIRIGRPPRRRASEHQRARLVAEAFVHLARALRTAT
jgi:IS6 family transposase